MTRSFAGFLLAICCASGASAQGPTIDQLLATPTAAEIVEKWKMVCLDHAGDQKAQRAAVKATGLTWPYQAYFNQRGKNVDCLVVSSTKSGTSISEFSGPLSSATAQSAQNVKIDGQRMFADIVLGGATYRIGISLENPGGNLVSSVVLAAK